VYGETKEKSYKKIQKQAHKEKQKQVYDPIQRRARERILHHIVCGEPFDFGWVSAATYRVSNPFSYQKQEGGWDKEKWENAMSVTCAIVRKYYIEKKEEFILELDTTLCDRDYLFGRLLAIADRLESHARYLQTKEDDKEKHETKKDDTEEDDEKKDEEEKDDEKRPTNAVRYMPAFAVKPLRTWKLIFDQLNPYIQRLDGAEWYQSQIDEIMSLFGSDDFKDRALDGKYLLGYSLQRRAIYNEIKSKRGGKTNEYLKED